MSAETSKNKPKKHSVLPVMAGLRLTRQRQTVYQTLMENNNHPTVNELFERVQKHMPSISLATVYNCLDALVQHGLVRQVNFEREPSRFCLNLYEHGHFLDVKTNKIYDITIKEGIVLNQFINFPENVIINEMDITFKGTFLPNRQ